MLYQIRLGFARRRIYVVQRFLAYEQSGCVVRLPQVTQPVARLAKVTASQTGPGGVAT